MLLHRQTRQRAPRPGRRRARPALETLEDRTLLASNLFVATTGDDSSGLGTLNQPYATLGKAVNVANPGDTIILRGGAYAGGVTITDASITIKSYDGEWAVISSPITNSAVPATIRFDIDAWNCKLQRLEIVGGYYYSVMTLSNWDSGVANEYGASNLTIEDSRLHDSGRDVIKLTPGSNDVIIRRSEIYNSGRRDPSNAEGIDNVNGDRMILQDSYIHDIATTGVYPKGGASNCIIERNLFNNIGQVGIMLGGDTDWEWFDDDNTQLYESIDSIARNNVVMNTQMAGIGLYSALRPQVYNNTLVNVAQTSQGAVLLTAVEHYVPPTFTTFILTPNTDVTFVNNIVTQSAGSTRPMFDIRVGGLTGSLTLNNNRYHDAGGAAQFWDERAGQAYYGSFAGWRALLGKDTSSSEGDPLLDANLHLTASSPAINAGLALANPGVDYDGGARTGTLDIGADEYGAGVPLQIPPPAGTIGTGGNGSSSGGTSNRPPSAANDSATTPEDAAVNLSVLGNDSDPDGDPLSISSFTQPSHGTVTNNGNGTLRFVPNADWNGGTSFSYTISDGKGGTATATVSLTVTPVNDPPSAANDSATTPEDAAVNLSVLGNDSDLDGDPLSISSFTQPSHGTVTNNGNGTLRFVPNANWNGGTSFSCTISDGKGGTATATVSLTVTPVNDAPDAVNDSAGTSQNTPITISVKSNDSDPDGDPLSVSLGSQPANGSAVVNAAGAITYTPNPSFSGSDSFTYTVNDGQGGTDSASVVLTVSFQNSPPVAVDDAVATNQDTPVTVSVKANDSDPDGDPLSLSLDSGPASGAAVVNADGTITYTPNGGFSGSDSFTYTVNDGRGGTDTARVSLTVHPTVPPPPPPPPDNWVGLEADPWDPTRQTLVVRGTAGKDSVYIQSKKNRKQVSVIFNGVSRGKFWLSQFSRIRVDGQAGDDRLEVNSGVKARVQLIGGPGDDVLLGGGGNDLLLGGDGDDWLEGRHGADVIIGGRDADRIWGGTYRLTSHLDRDDLLVAGTTRYDNDEAALAQICSEWSSGKSYYSRVWALNAGANGLPVLDTSTVSNDEDSDDLYGNSGLDWFFGNLEQDKLRDLVGGERVN